LIDTPPELVCAETSNFNPSMAKMVPAAAAPLRLRNLLRVCELFQRRALDSSSVTSALDAGRWTLDAGRWTLDAGRWTTTGFFVPCSCLYFSPISDLASAKRKIIALLPLCRMKCSFHAGQWTLSRLHDRLRSTS